MGTSDGGKWGPAKYNLKHVLRDIIFILRRWRRANSYEQSKRPRFRYDGMWCRSFESFDNSIEKCRCNVNNDDAFGSRGFFGWESDCDNHCFHWKALRENIDIFKGLEKGRGIDGEVGRECVAKRARGSEGLRGKRVPKIEA